MIPTWAKIVARGARNYYSGYPLVASIEATHSCTADCRHCDKGGKVSMENSIPPEGYAEIYEELHRPPVLQISGGEPLLREEVFDIIRSIKADGELPMVIFVTNGSLLDERKYLMIKKAGADRISVSLDFPDARHDNFRRLPGLFSHLNNVLPFLSGKYGGSEIALNTAITRENIPYLKAIAVKANEWGVGISYSAYTTMRTGDESLMPRPDDVEMLKKQMNEIKEMQAQGYRILNTPLILDRIVNYFETGRMPNCGAGRRFVVIRPDGGMNPCSMYRDLIYTRFSDMKRFVDSNRCEKCYVAIRAYSDRRAIEFFSEGKSMIRATKV